MNTNEHYQKSNKNGNICSSQCECYFILNMVRLFDANSSQKITWSSKLYVLMNDIDECWEVSDLLRSPTWYMLRPLSPYAPPSNAIKISSTYTLLLPVLLTLRHDGANPNTIMIS